MSRMRCKEILTTVPTSQRVKAPDVNSRKIIGLGGLGIRLKRVEK